MRHRLLLAALLAGSAFSPALAQEVEAAISTDTQAQATFQRVAMADEQEQRRGRGGEGGWRGRSAGGEGMRVAPEQVERAPRQGWQQRQQAQPQVQPQPQPVPQAQAQPRPDWSAQRAARMNNGGSDGGGRWQRREAPVVNTPVMPQVAQQAPAQGTRNWRGGNNNGGGDWNRDGARQAQVPGVPPTWQRRDRDGDGIPNARDRDRDGDGVRNNRDWDHNNNGSVDRRWDRNNNGTVDRRWDQNRDGVRDNRDWNGNNQRYGNNRGWNQQWRNDRRYDWQRYRTTNRNLFRQPRYYSPYGYNYSYQRFGIGIYLDNVLFGSRYRISDPWRYRLPDADWPYEWVRYYDDVLLVDTRDGYIVDVIYDFFW